MSEQLQAAEAVLATLQAGRTRLAVIAHHALPFGRPLALEPSGPATTTSAPVIAATPRIKDGSSAEEPAAPRPESAVQASTNLFDAPPPLARVAPPEQAPPDLPTDEDDISIDDLIHESLPSDAAPGQPVRTADLDDLLLDAEEDESGDTLSAVEAPTARIETTGPPPFRSVIGRSRAERSTTEPPADPVAAAKVDTATPVEDSSADPDAPARKSETGGFTLAAPRSVGPRVGGAPPTASVPSASAAAPGPSISLGAPRPVSYGARVPTSGLEVIDPGSDGPQAEPTGAAAIQILGVGQARTITPTLEVGSADAEADEDVQDAVRSAAGEGFSVGFVEATEEEADIPELSDGDEDTDEVPAASILTPDGMIPSESGRVQEAADDDADVRRFRAEAAAAERSGDLKAAVVSWTDVLDLRPSDSSAHLGRGRALVELRDYAAAMSDFQRAEDLAPDSALPLFEMGNLFFSRTDYQKAIAYFDQAIGLDNGHAMSWCRRGIAHHHLRNHAQALADLEEATALDNSIPGLRRYMQMASKAAGKRRR